ncbi:Myricetin O-methyltransferase [Vitis vinifera]|uniref:Myricetin O-methyltransferase n=1 Tax=Vitis vinifera TaxID=29760 RepID=A0A438IGP7_VITVI|nr:Myricetin O-methyltransferase [Vitis vinifera]
MCLAVFATFGLMGAVGTWLKNAIYAWGGVEPYPILSYPAVLIINCSSLVDHPIISTRLRGNDLTAFGIAHGMSFWDHGSRNLDFFSNLFNEGMASDESRMMRLTARTISEAFPRLKCRVFDLPHVVANLPEYRNLEFVGGDMFQSGPTADATLMKTVLHDWSDEDCVKIPRNAEKQFQGKKREEKVVIIEMETSLLNFSVRVRKSEAKDTMIQWLGMDLFEVPDKSQKGGLDVAPEINAWSGISKIASWSGTPTPLENKSKGKNTMAFEKAHLDLLLVPSALLIMFAYHLFLLYRYLTAPHTTVIGFENNDKRAWVDKRDVGIALNVIASNTSAATFLASVSLTLSSIIGAWIGSSSNNVFQSELIYGDTRPSTISIKYISLLTCFILAFSCFVQSARCFVHANYLISTPDSDIPVKNVEMVVIRAGEFWSLGLRAIYFAIDLLLWFFGPIPMFVCSVVLVILLYHLDCNSNPLHRHRSLASRSVKRVGEQVTAAAMTIEDHVA